jgi:hypothetical protein
VARRRGRAPTRPLVHVVAASLFLVTAAGPARMQGQAELTPAQRRTIDTGGQVFLTEDVRGSAWPRAWVYQFIDATPEEAAAVFADYPLHATYIPNVKKSVISRVIDRATVEVDYALRLPIVRDEQYTVRDRLSAPGGGSRYQVEWTLVRASSVKRTDGYVRFERYWNNKLQRDGTLMEYHNFVTPGSRLGGIPLIRSRALQQVRAAAGAVAAQVERERSEDLPLLSRQLRALRSALAP